MVKEWYEVIADKLKTQDDWKSQFGGETGADFYREISLDKVSIKAVNLVIKVNDVEVVRRRYEWDSKSKLESGTSSSNIKVGENGIEFI